MSNKRLGLILVAIVMVGLVGFGIWQATKAKPTPTQTATTNTTPSETTESDEDNKGKQQTTTTNKTAFTADEVKQHDKRDDCWTIIDGSVYNLTSYVGQHPGGAEIEEACGEDGSTMFNSRQDEDGNAIGSGTAHSNNAKQQLEQLKIGTLSN